MHIRRCSRLVLALFILTAASPVSVPAVRRNSPDEPPIVAASPGAMIDFYPVAATKQKGGRYINTRLLPRLGYIAAKPALQIESLRSVKRTQTTVKTPIESADGKVRHISNTMPAIEMTLSNADATAFADLMEKSVGQRIYIETQGKGIYAPLVRAARRNTTLTFTLGDEAQVEEVYRNLAPFVKK